jgi:hypothetical protein
LPLLDEALSAFCAEGGCHGGINRPSGDFCVKHLGGHRLVGHRHRSQLAPLGTRPLRAAATFIAAGRGGQRRRLLRRGEEGSGDIFCGREEIGKVRLRLRGD